MPNINESWASIKRYRAHWFWKWWLKVLWLDIDNVLAEAAALRHESQKVVDLIVTTGDMQEWQDGPEVARTYRWHEIQPLYQELLK